MIDGGEPGQVVVTSSGDGGFAPVATASVYAASKAAVSCFTEALQLNLVQEGTAVRASVFYPSGGLHGHRACTPQPATGPSTCSGQGAGTGRAGMTFEQLQGRAWPRRPAASAPWPTSTTLGEFAVDGALRRDFIIARDLDDTAELLHRRADAIGAGQLPPSHRLGV